MHITKFDDWPYWLQVMVIAPHALLIAFALWLWWPKTDEGWRKIGFVCAYLVFFLLIMHFVFGVNFK